MWIYKNKKITSIDQIPKNSFGFVYLITNLTSGKKYIGCKQFFSKRKRNFGKKELSKSKDKRLKKYEVVIKESNWVSYEGSNIDLKSDIKQGDKIKKEILCFVNTKKQLTYYEVKYMFKYNVLEDSNWYNGNILRRFFSTDSYL